MFLGAVTAMIKHDLILLPELIYPIEEWRLVERTFAPQFLPQGETIFAVANGYLGMRGTYEEREPAYRHGTFINGFHETWPIPYGERAFGFATTGQTIVNAPDGKIIRLYLDDEPFDLSGVRILRYERTLDMRAGTLDREVVWETPAGQSSSRRGAWSRFTRSTSRRSSTARPSSTPGPHSSWCPSSSTTPPWER